MYGYSNLDVTSVVYVESADRGGVRVAFGIKGQLINTVTVIFETTAEVLQTLEEVSRFREHLFSVQGMTLYAQGEVRAEVVSALWTAHRLLCSAPLEAV